MRIHSEFFLTNTTYLLLTWYFPYRTLILLTIIINNQTDMDISCNLFTKKFMQIAHECIPTNCVTIRPNDKIWMTSEIRKEIRIRETALGKSILKIK
jgi:hypothetical protein